MTCPYFDIGWLRSWRINSWLSRILRRVLKNSKYKITPRKFIGRLWLVITCVRVTKQLLMCTITPVQLLYILIMLYTLEICAVFSPVRIPRRQKLVKVLKVLKPNPVTFHNPGFVSRLNLWKAINPSELFPFDLSFPKIKSRSGFYHRKMLILPLERNFNQTCHFWVPDKFRNVYFVHPKLWYIKKHLI